MNNLIKPIVAVSSMLSLILIITSFFIINKSQKIPLLLTSTSLLVISYIAILYDSDCLNKGLSAIFSGSCGYSLSYIGILCYSIYLLYIGFKRKNVPQYYYELFTTLFVLLFSSIFIFLIINPSSFIIATQFSISALIWFIIIIINTIIKYYVTDG
jgi:hypothetical protein